MKKVCTLLLLIVGSYSVALAQQQPTHQVAKATPAEYVSVNVQSFLIRKNFTAYLSYGDNDPRSGQIKDQTGEKLEFANAMGVLKYMANHGWEFVAYIPDEDGKLSTRHFLMKREQPISN